jgi:hypothetical protein
MAELQLVAGGQRGELLAVMARVPPLVARARARVCGV